MSSQPNPDLVSTVAPVLRQVTPDDETDRPAPGRGSPVSLFHEQRTSIRVAYYLEINLYGQRTFCSGIVTNLCAGGLFVECIDFFEVDEVVKVDLELPGGPFWCDARVAWVRDRVGPGVWPGMGLEFLSLFDHHLKLLEHAVESAESDR